MSYIGSREPSNIPAQGSAFLDWTPKPLFMLYKALPEYANALHP
jgi:hypothetical protein